MVRVKLVAKQYLHLVAYREIEQVFFGACKLTKCDYFFEPRIQTGQLLYTLFIVFAWVHVYSICRKNIFAIKQDDAAFLPR